MASAQLPTVARAKPLPLRAGGTRRRQPAGPAVCDLAAPKFGMALRDITRSGEQNDTLSPSGVGSTRPLLLQDLPWRSKRDLQRGIAGFEADGTPRHGARKLVGNRGAGQGPACATPLPRPQL